jgi:hypothetical protein
MIEARRWGVMDISDPIRGLSPNRSRHGVAIPRRDPAPPRPVARPAYAFGVGNCERMIRSHSRSGVKRR